mmetsp:Transcript_66526/g.147350  ORF Transcript_66526/g.147350 Transcript_66526/m.147350 type:complete len:280 (-) Transcript_66526:98-937(-)
MRLQPQLTREVAATRWRRRHMWLRQATSCCTGSRCALRGPLVAASQAVALGTREAEFRTTREAQVWWRRGRRPSAIRAPLRPWELQVAMARPRGAQLLSLDPRQGTSTGSHTPSRAQRRTRPSSLCWRATWCGCSATIPAAGLTGAWSAPAAMAVLGVPDAWAPLAGSPRRCSLARMWRRREGHRPLRLRSEVAQEALQSDARPWVIGPGPRPGPTLPERTRSRLPCRRGHRLATSWPSSRSALQTSSGKTLRRLRRLPRRKRAVSSWRNWVRSPPVSR